jgi:hypothetical protein
LGFVAAAAGDWTSTQARSCASIAMTAHIRDFYEQHVLARREASESATASVVNQLEG